MQMQGDVARVHGDTRAAASERQNEDCERSERGFCFRAQRSGWPSSALGAAAAHKTHVWEEAWRGAAAAANWQQRQQDVGKRSWWACSALHLVEVNRNAAVKRTTMQTQHPCKKSLMQVLRQLPPYNSLWPGACALEHSWEQSFAADSGFTKIGWYRQRPQRRLSLSAAMQTFVQWDFLTRKFCERVLPQAAMLMIQ